MKIFVKCNLSDLEDKDTIAGYKVKDLIIFAKAVEAAGITNDELAAFIKNIDNAFDFVRTQQDLALKGIFDDIKGRYGF